LTCILPCVIIQSLEEAHSIVDKIENSIKQNYGNVDITIHIEPTNVKNRGGKNGND